MLVLSLFLFYALFDIKLNGDIDDQINSSFHILKNLWLKNKDKIIIGHPGGG